MVFGIECWDGSNNQVQSFINGTSPTATFPLLVKGSSVQIAYKTDYDWSMVIDQNGVLQYSDASADIGAITRKIDALLLSSLERPEISVQSFKLYDNFPNPFNPGTAISYRLSALSNVQLTVYNSLGQKVQTLVSGKQEAGSYSVTFDADGLSGGVYFYRLSTGQGFVQTKKMILVR